VADPDWYCLCRKSQRDFITPAGRSGEDSAGGRGGHRLCQNRSGIGPLSPPQVGEEITDDHLALIHRSWRFPKRDHEFNGQKMYQMHVIVFGTEAAIKQIDYVVYRLDKSYPCSVQVVSSKRKNFELKELANGYSLIRAEVYIRDQPKVVRLSRFIDLTDASPPLSLPIYRQPD
jgi:hypothetical protein